MDEVKRFCILFWFDEERHFSIQNLTSIVKPRRDFIDYQNGDVVTAKYRGKPYTAVIVRVDETKDNLTPDGYKLDLLLRDLSLTPANILEEMGVSSAELPNVDNSGLSNSSTQKRKSGSDKKVVEKRQKKTDNKAEGKEQRKANNKVEEKGQKKAETKKKVDPKSKERQIKAKGVEVDKAKAAKEMCRQILAKSSSTFSSSTSEDLAESPNFSNFMSAGCESECYQSTLQKACDERDQAKRRVEELELELNTLKERLTPAAFPGKVAFLKRLVEYYEGPLPANSFSDSSSVSFRRCLLGKFERQDSTWSTWEQQDMGSFYMPTQQPLSPLSHAHPEQQTSQITHAHPEQQTSQITHAHPEQQTSQITHGHPEQQRSQIPYAHQEQQTSQITHAHPEQQTSQITHAHPEQQTSQITHGHPEQQRSQIPYAHQEQQTSQIPYAHPSQQTSQITHAHPEQQRSQIPYAHSEQQTSQIPYEHPEQQTLIPYAHPEQQTSQTPHAHQEQQTSQIPHAHPEQQTSQIPHAHPEQQTSQISHAHSEQQTSQLPHAHPEQQMSQQQFHPIPQQISRSTLQHNYSPQYSPQQASPIAFDWNSPVTKYGDRKVQLVTGVPVYVTASQKTSLEIIGFNEPRKLVNTILDTLFDRKTLGRLSAKGLRAYLREHCGKDAEAVIMILNTIINAKCGTARTYD